LLPVVAFGDGASATVDDDTPLTAADIPALMKTDGLWQPVLPPTSSDGADALDRQFYSQFDNDRANLENEPGSSKAYALLPHGSLVSYYDDNVSLTPTHREGDLAVAAEPGLALGWGNFRAREDNFLIADYTGRWTAYLEHSSADSYEQFATVQAQIVLAEWKFDTNFSFVDLDDVDVDSGTRNSRQIYDTVQQGTYNFSDKDFVEVRGQNVLRDYESGPGSVEWQGRGLYNYRWDPKLTVGGGVAGGVLDVDNSTSQTYEQVLVRALYDPTEKISTQSQGGVELRQLGNGEDRVTPVFELDCEYQMRQGTNIDLSGYRRISASNSISLQNLDYTATGAGLAVEQNLGVSWLATLRGGYENNSYFYTDIGAGSPRGDDFFYINPAVQYRLTDHAKLEIFYNHRQNDSNNSTHSFMDDQTGIRASIYY
jgi:hypothetical protein